MIVKTWNSEMQSVLCKYKLTFNILNVNIFKQNAKCYKQSKYICKGYQLVTIKYYFTCKNKNT